MEVPESFDPYHKWLGIPPSECPPNHYRLLGIPLFECDPDVIQNAVDQRMAYLKSLSTGRHVVLAQRLLNELARAKVCLLSPPAKSAYDAAMQTAITPGGQTVTAQSASPPVITTPVLASLSEEPTPAIGFEIGQQERVYGTRRRPVTHKVVSITGTVLSAALGLAAGWFLLNLIRPQQTPDEDQVSVSQPTEDVGKQEPPTTARQDKPQTPKNDKPTLSPQPTDGSSEPVAKDDSKAALRPPSPPAPPPQPNQGSNTSTVLSPPRLPLAGEGNNVRPPAETRGSSPARAKPARLESLASPKDGELRPPPERGKESVAPRIVLPNKRQDVRKKVVLDLAHSETRVTLSDAPSSDKTEVQVGDIAELDTPYEIKPNHGIIRLGKPVEIALTDYSGVSIQILLLAGKDTTVKVAPQAEIGPGRKVGFTQQRVKRSCADLKKDANNLDRRLSAARNEAQGIEVWLASPVTKPLQLRGQKRQQLFVLANQTIPALEQQLSDVQCRLDVLQRFSELAKQVHGKASIELILRCGVED
jgi:hypothetical protein